MRPRLKRLFDDQNGICALCHYPMLPEDASVDHVIPQKFARKYPSADPIPLRAAHKICNSVRGHDMWDRPPYYYHEERLRIEARLRNKQKRKTKKAKVKAPRVEDIVVPLNKFHGPRAIVSSVGVLPKPSNRNKSDWSDHHNLKSSDHWGARLVDGKVEVYDKNQNVIRTYQD